VIVLSEVSLTTCPVTTSISDAPRKIPVLSLATVQVSSEADGHPIDLVFEDAQGPGTFHWLAAEPGDQTVTMTFHQPCTIERVIMETEECDVTRTQEVQLASSKDGGITYRELVRQEFNFSPDGTTWEHEDWTIRQDQVTHLRFLIKPDKRRMDLFATLTSLVLF
jgi:hypothetical protein